MGEEEERGVVLEVRPLNIPKIQFEDRNSGIKGYRMFRRAGIPRTCGP